MWMVVLSRTSLFPLDILIKSLDTEKTMMATILLDGHKDTTVGEEVAALQFNPENQWLLFIVMSRSNVWMSKTRLQQIKKTFLCLKLISQSLFSIWFTDKSQMPKSNIMSLPRMLKNSTKCFQ
jgi:hypothetical protein